LDHSVNHGATKRDETNEPQALPFLAHLSDFLRHNLSYLLAAGLVLLLLQDIFGTHGVLAMKRSQREVSQVQRQINEINNENRQLQERVNALKTDPEAIERIAREEMGLARPGEYIFKVDPKPGDDSSKPSSADPAQKP
jgi:cell division protein FtsB